MKKKISLCINFVIILALFTSCTKVKDTSINTIEIAHNLSTRLDSKLEQTALTTKSEQYQQAIDAIKEKRYPEAIGALSDLGDYKYSKGLLEQLRYLINGSYIGNGIWAVGAITADRGVLTVYKNDKIGDIYSKAESWGNIKSIYFRGGDSIEGLTAEGKIVTTSTVTKEELLSSPVGLTSAMANVIESVSSWRNIKSFQTFYPQTAVALTDDGFVYAAYPFYQDGTVKLQDWKDIVAVANGRGYVAGIKEDGTVLCNVYAYLGTIDASEWKDIVAISEDESLIGLREDGTVVSTGLNRWGEGNVSNWTDIIAISTCHSCTLGLKRDGKVVAAGRNDFGQMNVDNWKDIVAIAAGDYFSIGLKADGTMVLAGDCSYSGTETPDVSGMKGLYVPQISINK